MWLKERWTPFNIAEAYTHFRHFTEDAGLGEFMPLSKHFWIGVLKDQPAQGQEALTTRFLFMWK